MAVPVRCKIPAGTANSPPRTNKTCNVVASAVVKLSVPVPHFSSRPPPATGVANSTSLPLVSIIDRTVGGPVTMRLDRSSVMPVPYRRVALSLNSIVPLVPRAFA